MSEKVVRPANSPIRNRVYVFGGFWLDASERVIKSAGRPLPVSPKALDVLVFLVENRGHIVEKQALMSKVWPETFVEENTLSFNISVLRKLLADSSTSPRYIETVPKRGYRFIAEVVENPADQLAAAQSNPEAPPANLNSTISVPGTMNDPEEVRSSFRRVYVSIAVVMVALIGFLIWRVPGKPKLPEKDAIVLADFVNQTGDSVFDGTMRQGLAIQLEQSPYLSLVSEQRVRQTLRFMRQPADVVTPELAREICHRTGSSAVLEGSITRLGSEYVLGLRATNCTGGEILDNQQLQVRRKEDVLGALTQIAHQFRSRMGESQASLQKHDVPLAEATTGRWRH